MREILFRGRRTDNGEWVVGLLARYHPKFEVANIVNEFELLVPVKTETVGQFTGLTDKNGKKIFEGDIIENIDGRAIVFFDKIPCGFYMRFLDAYDDTPLDMSEMWDDTEVIGNIHDNPELLGGDDQ